MAAAALGGHDGAVAGADPHLDTELQRRDVQPAKRLDEPEPGLLVIGQDVPRYRAAASRGEPDGFGLGDQIADGQHQTIATDQNAAAGALGSERPGGEGVVRNARPQAEHCTQRAVEIKVAFAGLRLDLARDLPVYVSRHGGNSSVAPGAIITRKECVWFVFLSKRARTGRPGCRPRLSATTHSLIRSPLDNLKRHRYLSSTLGQRVLTHWKPGGRVS